MTRSVTRAGLLTPAGRGAIATIAVDGPSAVAVVESLFCSAAGRHLIDQPIDHIFYGIWKSTGEDVVVARRGNQRIEVHCHGGAAASTAILETLADAGCEIADWQGFVRGDALNAIRGEALVALAEASTERTAAILLEQYQGALDAAIGEAIAHFQRGSKSAGLACLAQLLQWSEFGAHLTKPWRVVIAGPPNVGKSTLLNALVGYERAIVFDQPGTTRDVVSSQTAVNGWPIELSDTAGLHAAAEPIELAGVQRARAEMGNADLVILVTDMTQPWSKELEQLAGECPEALVIHNKVDKTPPDEVINRLADRPTGLPISARFGQNLSEALAAIATRLVPAVPTPRTAIPFTVRQAEAIRSAKHLAEQGFSAGAISALARLVAPFDRQ
jgi:tRNA modification GTPase